MHILNYLFMCLFIGIYLIYHLSGTPFPAAMKTVNIVISCAFLLWGGYYAGRVILDCIMSSFNGQMSAEHIRSGITLAIVNYAPTVLMSVFMLKEGFK